MVSIESRDLSLVASSDTSPTGIMRLPAEIYIEIFLILRDSHPFGSGAGVWPILFVCKAWRAIGLEHGQLWNAIYLGGPRWISELLYLSRETPRLTMFSPRNGMFLSVRLHRVVFRELHRIQSLHLDPPSAVLNRILYTLAPVDSGASSPMRHLELRTSDDSLYCLPLNKFFPANSSAIRDINVNTYVACSWPEGLVPTSLRSLCITQRDNNPHDLADLRRTLTRLPLLECLKLDGLLPSCDPDKQYIGLSEVRDPLTLSRLTKLGLNSSVARCAWFLAQLRLPVLRDLVIKCYVDSSSADIHIQALDPVLMARWTDTARDDATQAPELVSFALDATNSWKETTFAGWASCDAYPLEKEVRRQVRSIHLTVSYEGHQNQSEDISIGCCQMFSLSNVQDLWVYPGGSEFNNSHLDAWRVFKTTEESVKTLHIYGRPIDRPLPFYDCTERYRPPKDVSYPQWETTLKPKLHKLFPGLTQILVNGKDGDDLRKSYEDRDREQMQAHKTYAFPNTIDYRMLRRGRNLDFLLECHNFWTC